MIFDNPQVGVYGTRNGKYAFIYKVNLQREQAYGVVDGYDSILEWDFRGLCVSNVPDNQMIQLNKLLWSKNSYELNLMLSKKDNK